MNTTSKRGLSIEDFHSSVTKRANSAQEYDEEDVIGTAVAVVQPCENYELSGLECTWAWEPTCNPRSEASP